MCACFRKQIRSKDQPNSEGHNADMLLHTSTCGGGGGESSGGEGPEGDWAPLVLPSARDGGEDGIESGEDIEDVFDDIGKIFARDLVDYIYANEFTGLISIMSLRVLVLFIEPQFALTLAVADRSEPTSLHWPPLCSCLKFT